MLLRRYLIAALLVAGTPLFAQYRSYSPWQPTNAAGVSYRWHVDDLNPPACTVQLQVDGPKQEPPRIAISYRTRRGLHMTLTGANMNLDPRKGPERLLIGCTFIDRVELIPLPRNQSIIAGSIKGGL
jgi:hypothetical protein